MALRFTGFAMLSVCMAGVLSAATVPDRVHPPPLDFGDARAVVLFFIASDCPISNRTLPEMRRVEQAFSSRGVRFRFIYPNATETSATRSAHQVAFGLRGDTLDDPDQTLVGFTHAAVTPEAAILIRQGTTLRTVYLGRVDDRFLHIGTERPAPTRHDLEDALAALLERRPIPPPGGPPVGCSIVGTR